MFYSKVRCASVTARVPRLYQLCFDAHQNPSCHQTLQKLLLLVWCGSSPLLPAEHRPSPTAPSRHAGRGQLPLLHHRHVQPQVLPAEQTGLYVCGLGKRQAMKEPCSVTASGGTICPNKLCSNPFQCLSYHQRCGERGESAAGAVHQQCLVVGHRSHHASLFKTKGLFTKKRGGKRKKKNKSTNRPCFCAVQPESKFY